MMEKTGSEAKAAEACGTGEASGPEKTGPTKGGKPRGGKRYEIDILGKETGANIIALGALAVLSGVVSLNSLEAASKNRVSRGTEEFNRKALKLGIQAAKNAMKMKVEFEEYEDPSDQ